MSEPVESLTEQVLALPAEARIALADRLVESLDPLADEAVRSAWEAEAVRRRDEVRSGQSVPVAEEVAAAHVRSFLKK